MEEVKETKEKKVRKPRAKKAAEQETKAVAIAEETPVEQPKKKAPAKRKKAEAPKAEQPVEEKPVEEKPAEEKPKKKAPAKRKKAEAPKEEPPAEEKPVEEKPAEEKPVEEKPIETAEVKTEEPKKEEPKKAKKEVKPTRAERIEGVKAIVRETLQNECKWSDLLDKVAALYLEKYPSEKTDKVNDLNGRIGSIIGQMKKDGEVLVAGGVATLVRAEAAPLEIKEEPAPLAEEKAPEAVVEAVPAPVVLAEVKEEEKPTEQKKEDAPVYDLSSLFAPRKPAKTEKKEEPKTAVKEALEERVEETEKTVPQKAEETPAEPKKQEKKEEKPVKPAEKKTPEKKPAVEKKPVVKKTVKAYGSDGPRDPLKEAFLKRLRSLGGEYFEYYAIYLLEKYSRRNGRRLEGLKVSGGEYDGGIDGELELSDRLGFKETLYVQAKNWAPTDEKWLVGETLLQQFIGAVSYRQAQEGKLHARGVYMTTSYFSSGAKQMLEKLSDRFVGYDGDDLYETAKECSFGLKEVNGVWKLDEDLLAGEKAFFSML